MLREHALPCVVGVLGREFEVLFELYTVYFLNYLYSFLLVREAEKPSEYVLILSAYRMHTYVLGIEIVCKQRQRHSLV